MNFVRNILSRLGYEVVRDRKASLRALLRDTQIDHVIDVGANRGQFIQRIRECGYTGLVSAFEPISEHEAQIAVHAPVSVTTAAVGRSAGNVTLNLYSSSDFSSVHELSGRYRAEYDNGPVATEAREVPMVALDDLSLPGNRKLLKIDTQGHDAEVLRGAERTLETVAALYLELPFLNIYEGGCSVAEMFALTEAAGLFPARFFANSITSWGAWVDGDVIFVRKP